MAATTIRNFFAGNPLDRAEPVRKNPDRLAQAMDAPAARFMALAETRPLLDPRGVGPLWLSRAAVDAAIAGGGTVVLLGLDDARVAHFAVDVTGAGPVREMLDEVGRFADLRAAMPRIDWDQAGVLAQAKALIDWHARHRFCAQCGGPTDAAEGGYVRHCRPGGCGAHHFPRTDPVVIMLAVNGDRCLLGRQRMFPRGMYSALAGFVEQGETIEEAVRREVSEEAGIAVGRVRYLASQPWPFPSSLMIGCLAEATSETIELDGEELEHADWYHRADIEAALAGDRSAPVQLPPPQAIASQLVQAWIAGETV